MSSDEKKLAMDWYMKNPEFRAAVNNMYKKKAAKWAKDKSSKATKVSPTGYAKRAAMYLVKTGVPTGLMASAFTAANAVAVRASGQGAHVNVLDVALTGFNQSRAVMNANPAGFYHATMEGVGRPAGRRVAAALENFVQGTRGGDAINAVRAHGQAAGNYMQGGAYAVPTPAPMQDPLRARNLTRTRNFPNRNLHGMRGHGPPARGGAPPESGFKLKGSGEPLFSQEALGRMNARFEARQARDMAADAIYNKGRLPLMDRFHPDQARQTADKAATAILNHAENKSDLARHLQHEFKFAGGRESVAKPGHGVSAGGHKIAGASASAAEQSHLPSGGIGGGELPENPFGQRGFGTGLGFDPEQPMQMQDIPGGFSSEYGQGFQAPNPQPGVYDPMDTLPNNYSQMRVNEFKHASFEDLLGQTPTGSVSSTPRSSVSSVAEEFKTHGWGTTDMRGANAARLHTPPGSARTSIGSLIADDTPRSSISSVGSMQDRVLGYDPFQEIPENINYGTHEIAAAQATLRSQAEAVSDKGIRGAFDRMDRATTIPGKIINSMVNRGGNIGKMGQYIIDNGQQIGGGFAIAGGAMAAAGIAYGGVQLHKMHKYRDELRSIADEHPDDTQVQEFFKLNDEATKRNDVYFGLNTFAGSLAIGAGVAGGVAAFGAGLGFAGAATAAGLAAGPIGWAALGIGAAVWAFTSIFESGAKKKAYREYMQNVYGSADAPSLDYYLDHKDPGLLKAVNSVKNYQVKDDATDEFKSYMDGLKGDINSAEASIKVEEGVDDPRRAQLASILSGTVPAGELDKTSDFISRQHAQDVQNGHGPSQTWSKDDIVNHAKKQFHSDQYRYAHRTDPNLGPDLVNQTEQDYYDNEDKKNGTETHRWGYGGRSMPGAKQEETPETDVL